jgi:hypothetical protein
MAHPYHHAVRSAKLFGGSAEDYVAIHSWFDESKAHFPDLRHRALRHHAEGIFLCERIFGVTVRTSAGREVPVRLIGEQHVKDDLGWIPTAKDWLQHITVQPWMARTAYKPMRDGADPVDANPDAAASESAHSACHPASQGGSSSGKL